MLGAGIFVFPGLAGGDAGFLAIISFFIGGIIALCVAACTAELATAMPNSGGGYYFISRSFGTFWGTLVGISQWIGLVFACAFYLVSFAEYAITLLKELNLEWNIAHSMVSFGFTLFLLAMNIMGTKKVGQLQNVMVISLTILLVLIFSYGILDYFGFKDEPFGYNDLAPSGPLSIFTTTALIFTSYLGFVQIANVGSEIKKPDKNLPRALIWSVVIAMGLYMFIMAVSTFTFSQGELKEYGEIATIEVARKILGNWGAIIIVFAGFLAALSSANASMMSASRGVYALGKDGLISPRANRVNRRFGTPHIALILVALPVSIMLMRSNLEVFAEVASLLHLIIYAGICMALLKLRATDPFWYIPAFRVPMAKAVAGFGGLGCLALVFFMQYLSIAIGCAVIALSALYYLIHIRKQKITLTRPKPRQIDENLINPAILVPIDITREGKSLPQSVLKVLPISKLLLLGFKETPEQSGQEQLEEKYGEEGQEMLGALAKQLEEVSVDYESRLIFSNDVGTQIKELLKEEDLQFILSLKPISALQQLTIPIFHKSQVTQQLISIMYNVQYNHFSKIRILLFVDEDPAKSQEAILRQAMEQRTQKVGMANVVYEVEHMKKASLKKIAQKIETGQELVIWSEAEPSEPTFFLNIILEKYSKEHRSPAIIILRKEKDDQPTPRE